MAPLGLQVGPRRPVEERRLQLAPPPLEPDPRVGGKGRCGRAGDGVDHGLRLEVRVSRVVAAHALRSRRAQVERGAIEVRVRAGGRVDHGVGAAHLLELGIRPAGALSALVLAVAHLVGHRAERSGGVGRVEVELDHLPVALVEVVPVVEHVEHPVLERDVARVAGVGGHVRVHHRRVPGVDAPRPVHVPAAGVQGVSGEVQVVLVEPVREVGGRRPGLDQIASAPRPAQRDGGRVHQQVDVGGDVGLAGAAAVGRHELDHRCIPRGQRDLERRRRGQGGRGDGE